MPSASYYREQARLLLRWANKSQDESAAQRLTRRARDMLDLAEQAQDQSATLTSALDLFNSRQMFDQDKAEA
jgi:hypothetical protein